MAYEKLSIQDFGRKLLETNDLDPVYMALMRVPWDKERKYRWLVAYWCFYDCGVATCLSEFEGEPFWDAMTVAAKNETEMPIGGRWKRAAERRHFRGKQATDAVLMLSLNYEKPEDMVKYIIGETTGKMRTFKEIAARVKEHRAFGPWMAFKVADMLDCVLGISIDFDKAAVFMFTDPVKAVVMLWREKTGYGKEAKPKDLSVVIDQVVDLLTKEFGGFLAPPAFERPVGLQEVETVLCKWKSHMNGHYPIGKDTREIRTGLAPWAQVNQAAKEFLEYMPK